MPDPVNPKQARLAKEQLARAQLAPLLSKKTNGYLVSRVDREGRPLDVSIYVPMTDIDLDSAIAIDNILTQAGIAHDFKDSASFKAPTLVMPESASHFLNGEPPRLIGLVNPQGTKFVLHADREGEAIHEFQAAVAKNQSYPGHAAELTYPERLQGASQSSWRARATMPARQAISNAVLSTEGNGFFKKTRQTKIDLTAVTPLTLREDVADVIVATVEKACPGAKISGKNRDCEQLTLSIPVDQADSYIAMRRNILQPQRTIGAPTPKFTMKEFNQRRAETDYGTTAMTHHLNLEGTLPAPKSRTPG